MSLFVRSCGLILPKLSDCGSVSAKLGKLGPKV